MYGPHTAPKLLGIALLTVAALYVVSLVVMASIYPEDSRASDNKRLVAGNTRFAVDLYKQLDDSEGNIFISPYSITAALAMTYAGAREGTAREMAEVLHFMPGQETLHPAMAGLGAHLSRIGKNGEVQLSIANSLWPQRGYPFREEFLAFVKKHYGSPITPVDFAGETEKTRLLINAWVEEQTQDKIQELIRKGQLDPSNLLALVNAVYFKGDWASRFDPGRTGDAEFTLPDGETKLVPMMSQQGTFGYREFDHLQVLELPYEGERLSMIILLPQDRHGLGELEEELETRSLDAWLTSIPEEAVHVCLPRFTITWGTTDLAPHLSRMGMRDAFIPGSADFSGMDGTRRLFIGLVLHKTFIDVNEKGTEAAAATAVLMKKGPQPHIFRADHPFIFLIRENETGSILFLGRLADPAS